MKFALSFLAALFFASLAQAQVLGGGSSLSIGAPLVGGTPGDCLYVATGPVLGQQSCGSATISIGGMITSSTAGYGLYVGTGGNAGLLEQFAYGSNVFTALGVATETTGTLIRQNGAITSGNCLKWSATGIQDFGAACLTAPGGSSGQIQYNSSSAFAGANLWQGTNVIQDLNGSALTTAQVHQWYYQSDTAPPTTNYSYAQVDPGTTANTLKFGSYHAGSPAQALTKLEIDVDGSNKLDFGVTNAGNWTSSATIFTPGIHSGANNANVNLGSGTVAFFFAATQLQLQTGVGSMVSTYQWGWSSGAAGATDDTILTRGGAPATLQMGAADAAAPVAQAFQVQSVVAGTSNTAGAAWTHNGSRGTGTGVGGDIIFKVAKAGTTGTAQNALTEAFRIAAATALPEWPSSTTAAGTQTYTNSPCSGLTTEQWVPIQIIGQTGTWYIPACQ